MRIAEIDLGAQPSQMRILAMDDFQLVLRRHFKTVALIGNL